MAWVEMDQVFEKGEKDEYTAEKTVSLSSVANGDWILVPMGINYLSMTLIPTGGGKGKVQFTTDTLAVVKAGTAETAIDWPAGEVAVNTSDRCIPVTALRLVQTFAGATKLTIRGQ